MQMHPRTAVLDGHSPELLLRVRWRKMNTEELARYIRRVIVAERRCIAGESPRHVAPRLRWRRLAAARRLRSLGHFVQERVFSHPNARVWSSGERVANVPPRYSWPGVFSLVPLEGAGGEG
jgi:hypothetical protein